MEEFSLCTCGISQRGVLVWEEMNPPRGLRPSETMCSAVDSEDSEGPWSDRPMGATLVGIQVLRNQA